MLLYSSGAGHTAPPPWVQDPTICLFILTLLQQEWMQTSLQGRSVTWCTDHPAALVAGRQLKMRVLSLRIGGTDDIHRHGDDLLKQILVTMHVPQAKIDIPKALQDQCNSNLQFIVVTAPSHRVHITRTYHWAIGRLGWVPSGAGLTAPPPWFGSMF